MRKRLHAAVVALAVASLSCGFLFAAGPPAAAQEVSPEDRARLEALFDAITKNPTNLDLSYEYAKAATEAGDYEAAITAYERLLLFNPNLPRVKAELGVLYFRLGSFDTAKAYLEQALTEGDPPSEARARIERFLAAIESRQSPHKFSGSAAFGLRYQSNANYGPDGQILLFDTLVDPDDQTEGDDDFNAFASVRGQYVYDLGNDAGDTLSVDASFYESRQFNFSELDVEQLFIKAGPGFRLYPTDSGPVLFRPHLRLTYIRLDDETYNFSGGFGFRSDWQMLPDTALFLEAFVENREYYATDERENADTQDGYAWRFQTGAVHSLNKDLAFRGELFGGQITADDSSEAYAEFGLAMGVSTLLASPFEGSEDYQALAAPWNLSVNARYARRVHDAANVLVSNTIREDDDFRLDGTLAVPVGTAWSVFANVGYQDNRSTVLNNEFQNFSATLGANYRF